MLSFLRMAPIPSWQNSSDLRKKFEHSHMAVGVKELIGLPRETIEDRFNLTGDSGRKIRRDHAGGELGQIGRLERVVALVGDGDDVVAEAHGEEELGGGGDKAGDTHGARLGRGA